MSTIAHIGDAPPFKGILAQALLDLEPGIADRAWGDEFAQAGDPELAAELASSAPDVVVLGPGLDIGLRLTFAYRLQQHRPATLILLVADLQAHEWPQAMRAGIREVVSPGGDAGIVRDALARTLRAAEGLRRIAPPPPPTARPRGRIVVISSPKGGSGKTTIASNVLVGLARGGARPVIVDLDLQFGDVASALGLDPVHTIADAARLPQLDRMALKAFLVDHSSGAYALCAPNEPAEADDVKPQWILDELLPALADEFSHVVVDTGPGLDEHTLSALDLADDVVLVCAMDVPSIRSMRKALEALERIRRPVGYHLLLNRASSKVGLSAGDVERALGMHIEISVPSTRAFPLSLNQGRPLLASQPRSAGAKPLARLVELLYPQGGGER